MASDAKRTLVLSGEVDLLAASDLREEIRRLCAEKPAALVLDLRRVTFMDSAGLRATISAYELCRKGGYGFSVIPGPRQVQRLFELTGLASILGFQHDGQRPARPENALPSKLVVRADRFDSGSDAGSPQHSEDSRFV
jgi:anti-sigma B factor antagonist